jgi:hypothetical protein
MNVRTRAQERNQDLEHGLHVKLSDDELVRQFTGKSSSDKLTIFKLGLRHSHKSFSDLIKAWIDDTSSTTSGGDSGPLCQRKASQIFDIIWQDENALLPLLEKTESFKERVITSTVKAVRSELDVLNTKVKVFGQFDPTMNPENLDLQSVLRGI